MKKINVSLKQNLLGISFFCALTPAFSQVAQIDDPLLKHDNYVAVQAGMNYVSPDYTYRFAYIQGAKFNLVNGVFQSYQPIAAFEIGHVFKIDGKPIILNSGVSIASYSLKMISAYNHYNPSLSSLLYPNALENQQLTETFFQVPLAISTHIPLIIYKPQGRYEALELKLGGYYGENIKREVQSNGSADNVNTDVLLPAHQYGTVSLLAEAAVSFTAPNGHSHQFGIRATHDTGPYFAKNATQEQELPFLYNSVGIFYRWVFYSF